MYWQLLWKVSPYLTLIVISCLMLRGLVAMCHVRPNVRQLVRLHGDQAGAVQSLSFVLTLPLFIIVLMFIVQLSQLTIGKVVVEYSAYCAARAAIVWLPANLGDGNEIENQFQGGWQQIGMFQDAGGGPMFTEYQIPPLGLKYSKIKLAAVMACMSITPSADVSAGTNSNPANPNLLSVQKLQQVYAALAPGSTSNQKIATRLNNKFNYALNNTAVDIRVRHRTDEPPLQLYSHLCRGVFPYFPGDHFQNGEFGWQDQIVVTVRHDFALLPGPARIIARRADAPIGSDPDQNPSQYYQNGTIKRRSQTLFVYPMSATVRLNNEGERSRLSYVQSAFGLPNLASTSSFDGNGGTTDPNAPNTGQPPCPDCPPPEPDMP